MFNIYLSNRIEFLFFLKKLFVVTFFLGFITFYSNPSPLVHNDGERVPIVPIAYPVEKKQYSVMCKNFTYSCFLCSCKSCLRLPLGALSTAGARLWAEGQQVHVKSSARSPS